MPALVPVPKTGTVLQGRGKPDGPRNGTQVTSVSAALFGRGGGTRADVIRNKNASRSKVGKMASLDSQAKLNRRKKLNGNLAAVTSTMSLGALGALGAGAGAAKFARAGSRAQKVGAKIKGAAAPISIGAGGVGGLNGYNYAHIQRQEARKRPVTKAYSAEANRHERNRKQQKAASTGGGLAFGAAGVSGANLVGRQSMVRSANRALDAVPTMTLPPGRSNKGMREAVAGRNGANAAAKRALNLTKVSRNRAGLTTAGLGALGVGGVVAADRIGSYSRKKGGSYNARYRKPE